MKLPDELDTGGKWELVFHRLQIAEEDLASERPFGLCQKIHCGTERSRRIIK